MHCAAFTSHVKVPRGCTRASSIIVRAAAQQPTRREAGLALAVAGLSLLSAQRAEAFLGIGEDAGQVYTDDTGKLLKNVNNLLALGPDEEKEEKVKELKKEMNSWTAKYRTNKMGGRPSFSNMYSAVNALAGHWNSFGADAPVPKKRMARISKELEDVEKLLARGR